jgi:hypothetical protein
VADLSSNCNPTWTQHDQHGPDDPFRTINYHCQDIDIQIVVFKISVHLGWDLVLINLASYQIKWSLCRWLNCCCFVLLMNWIKSSYKYICQISVNKKDKIL